MSIKAGDTIRITGGYVTQCLEVIPANRPGYPMGQVKFLNEHGGVSLVPNHPDWVRTLAEWEALPYENHKN